MKLAQLIKNLQIISISGSLDMEVSDVKTVESSVTKDTLFVCLKGKDFDGHEFAKTAENYGATAVIAEKELDLSITTIIVKDCRKALAQIAAEFYDNPAEKMSLIGVVGTNGKTTTSHMLYQVLNAAGINCGVIGTLGTYFNDKFLEPTLTTPDPLELNKILYDMYNSGVKTVVMEVSAHAIYWSKIFGLKFKAGIFTNLSRDHLDFFSNIEEYKKTKLSFFNNNACEYVVVNSDDEVGVELASSIDGAITYGLSNPADVFAIRVKEKDGKTGFVINLFDCIYRVEIPLVGRYNVSNALAAATVASLIGVSTKKVASGLNELTGVSGRLEKVYDKEFKVYVDYAHTPDGIKKVLEALRPICKNRLIIVFGCGGNRDHGKREEMGEIAKKYADFVVITSDNPRFEDPMDIINSIEKGVLKVGKEYVIVEDRAEGINYAINVAKEGDLIVVAGKGAENYQDVLGIKKPYNDKDTIEEIIYRRLS